MSLIVADAIIPVEKFDSALFLFFDGKFAG
jgi:hypothetical protein